MEKVDEQEDVLDEVQEEDASLRSAARTPVPNGTGGNSYQGRPVARALEGGVAGDMVWCVFETQRTA